MLDLTTTQIVLVAAAVVFNAALVWTAIWVVYAEHSTRIATVLQAQRAGAQLKLRTN